MTRANINLIHQKQGNEPTILAFYWNGDQYPTGIRDHYHVLDFLKGDLTPARFKKWAKTFYTATNVGGEVYTAEVEKVNQPRVYFTGSHITDYSYVFRAATNFRPAHVNVWEWDKPIFDGTVDEFILWFNKQGK